MTAALVIAHPGHELRLSAWLGRTGAEVCIIARGSRSGRSEARIAASRAVAGALGAQCGDPFGAAFDTDLYAAIMASDARPFLDLADRLAARFRARAVTRVVADGWQNYNPVHDLTHLVARVAAAGTGAGFSDFPVVLGDLAHAPSGPVADRIAPTADELRTRRDLIARYPEIAEDVAGLVAAAGDAALVEETLHIPLPLAELMPGDTPPWYEAHGAARVAAGVYPDCLRWRHMAPIVEALTDRLEQAG